MNRKPNIFSRMLFPFCIGIWVLRTAHFAELNSVLLISGIISFILLLIINYLYTLLKVYNHKIIATCSINLSLFLMGALFCSRHNDRSDFQHFSYHPASFFKIAVDSEPEQNGSILKFRARVIRAYSGSKKQPATGSLMIAIKYDPSHSPSSLQYGDVCFIPAKYKLVSPPMNPAEFDVRQWLANQNIYHQAFLLPAEITPSREQKGVPLIRFSLAFRKRQTDLYRKLIKDDQAFAVAATLILGYRSDLDAETLAAYSKTGTVHALSVSGMHVGIIYLVLEWALKWMNRKQVLLWLKVVLILTLIWCYALLTGYSASVLRSAIMLTLFILSKSFRKSADGYHTLCASAFFLLLYNPFLLWDVGFQLSYMAVFGLIYLQPRIARLCAFKQPWLQKPWDMISLSIAAQLLTFPFSVYYFHQFPVYFILSNLFITIPVTLLMYSGIAILLFRLYWLAPAFEWLIVFMNSGLEKIASLPYPVISKIWLTKTELILLSFSLVLLFMAGSAIAGSGRRKNLIFASFFLLAALQGIRVKDKIRSLRQQRVILFKVSKHNAASILSGKRAYVFTDLQMDSKAFQFHIQPALDQAGISKIAVESLKKQGQ